MKLIPKHQNGYYFNSPEMIAHSRANKVYNNYYKAKDVDVGLPQSDGYNKLRWLKENVADFIPTFSSNCVLTTTQWVDPFNPLIRSSSIWNTPAKYGYAQITSDIAIPGNLVIARNPNNETYHTMMVSGFTDKDFQFNFNGKIYPIKKGEVLVDYSKGGDKPSNLRKNIPLSVYIANSDGKTDIRYYRYNYPNSILLDEVTVNKPKN